MSRKSSQVEQELDSTQNSEFSLDMSAITEMATSVEPMPMAAPVQTGVVQRRQQINISNDQPLVNCLRNEIIEVRFIPQAGKINDPKHVMFGGLGENSKVIISVPRLRSGTFVNVLTNEEKAFLEYELGLEVGALSVHNKTNNFWSNTTEGGISKVILHKRDNRLNLADPEDFIKYKILLANKDLIAPDLQTLQDKPKATYRFVLVSDSETSMAAKSSINIKHQAWMEFGKISNNADVLKTVLEMITAKPVSKNTKLDYLQTEVGKCLEGDTKTFLQVVRDPLLTNKILIKKAVECGLISKKSDFYYLKSDKSPLCESGEDSTLTVAAKFLNAPKNQEMKLLLEAGVADK